MSDSLAFLLGPGLGAPAAAAAAVEGSKGRHQRPPRSLLTWERFVGWMAESLRGSPISASSLFREIFSYIKGSTEAMSTEKGALSSEAIRIISVARLAFSVAIRRSS